MRKLLTVMWVGISIMTTCEAANSIPFNLWTPGLGAKKDNGNLAIQVPDDSKVGDLITGLKKPLTLKPGIYAVFAVVKAEPLQNMGYRIVLTVRDAKNKPYIGPRSPWQQLTPRPKESWVATDEARAFQHDKNGVITLKATFAVMKKGDYQIAVGWKIGEYHWRGRSFKNPFQASLDKLTLQKLSYTKLTTNVLMGTLTADKVVYKPGMAPTLKVPIQYVGRTEREITCRVKMSKDIEAPVVVATKKVGLKPFSTTDFEIELPVLEKFGGYRFDLERMDGDKVV